MKFKIGNVLYYKDYIVEIIDIDIDIDTYIVADFRTLKLGHLKSSRFTKDTIESKFKLSLYNILKKL